LLHLWSSSLYITTTSCIGKMTHLQHVPNTAFNHAKFKHENCPLLQLFDSCIQGQLDHVAIWFPHSKTISHTENHRLIVSSLKLQAVTGIEWLERQNDGSMNLPQNEKWAIFSKGCCSFTHLRWSTKMVPNERKPLPL